MFRDDSTQKEVEDHYGRLLNQLKPFGASLKAAAQKEKIEKDELEAEMERWRRQRLTFFRLAFNNIIFTTYRRIEAIKVWATDEQRLKWHQDTDLEYEKCKNDINYVCSDKYIRDSNKFGPAEVALQSPYRAGMCRNNFGILICPKYEKKNISSKYIHDVSTMLTSN